MSMVTVGMYYEVLPDKGPAFRAFFEEVRRVLDQTPGHRETFLYQRVDDPNSYAILSEWEDRESFLNFVRSEAFREVTTIGREQMLRTSPRHKIYPRSEDIGRPPGV